MTPSDNLKKGNHILYRPPALDVARMEIVLTPRSPHASHPRVGGSKSPDGADPSGKESFFLVRYEGGDGEIGEKAAEGKNEG
eukprot:1256136-Amorphochlora_amoeboformis.AAC.1